MVKWPHWKKLLIFLLKQIHFFTHVILFGDFCFSLPPSHRIRYSGKKNDDFNGQSPHAKTVGKIFHRLKNFKKCSVMRIIPRGWGNISMICTQHPTVISVGFLSFFATRISQVQPPEMEGGGHPSNVVVVVANILRAQWDDRNWTPKK